MITKVFICAMSNDDGLKIRAKQMYKLWIAPVDVFLVGLILASRHRPSCRVYTLSCYLMHHSIGRVLAT